MLLLSDVRWGRVGGGARWFVRLLVFLLVPAVWLGTTEAAEAATNLNQWQTAHVGKSDILVGIDQIDCTITSRYTGVGESVAWANSACVGGPDTSTGFAQPGEPGSHITLEWKGTRAGEVAATETWQGGLCGGSTLSGDTQSTCVTFNGFPALSIYSPSHDVSSTGNWMLCVHKAGDSNNYQAAYTTIGGNYVAIFGSGSVAADWERVFYSAKSVGCAGASGAKIHVEARGYNWLVPDAGEPAGAGAGNACKASSGQLTLGASSQNNWSGIASTVPNGAADVPEAVGGVCTFTQLCATFHSDNGIMPDSQFTSCSDLSWPAAVMPPAAGNSSTEPTAGPAPGHENPAPPTTEPGFWEAILGALAAGFKMLWNALTGIFSLLGKIVVAIMDGLKALFIPSTGFMDAEGSRLTDTVQDSNLNQWTDQWHDGLSGAMPGGATSPAAAKTTTEGITTTTSADGGGSWGLGDSWGAGCAGPGFTWDKFATVGLPANWHPLDACSGTMSKVAMWTKRLATVGVVLGAMLKILQMLAVALGASRNINALNFDWSGSRPSAGGG